MVSPTRAGLLADRCGHGRHMAAMPLHGPSALSHAVSAALASWWGQEKRGEQRARRPASPGVASAALWLVGLWCRVAVGTEPSRCSNVSTIKLLVVGAPHDTCSARTRRKRVDWGGMGHKGRRRALSLLSHAAAAEAHEQT